MSFFAGQYTSVYSLNRHITCRLEARQALIYQLVLGLTGKNDMYNYSKAVHVYPPFFDISCSAKNYKIAPALTPLDGSEASAKFLSERFPNSVPKSQIELPNTAAELLAQYDEAIEQLEAVTEQKQRAENLLKEMLGDNEIGTAGDRIITWKSISQERLDSKTLKAEHPALCKKYTNKTSYRRFTIKTAS